MLGKNTSYGDRGGGQQGDRMETWALRMCLLNAALEHLSEVT